MNHSEQSGAIRIADDVVATIAALAATETSGVAAMSGGISEGIARRISGKNAQKGVEVEVGTTETAIDLRVVIQYGNPIHVVCHDVQRNVKQAVESMTGLKVVEVNVKVEGVAFMEEPKE